MNTENEKKRLFIAVPVSSEIQQWLSAWMSDLQRLAAFRRWTHPLDYHLTMKFLGETAEEKIPSIIEQLNRKVANKTPFTLTMQDLGHFGPPKSPSVLWAGIGGDTDRLLSIYNDTEEAVLELGWPREQRSYHPHLTLARQYKGSVPYSDLKLPSPYQSGHHPAWTVDRILLYRSHLNRKPMYEPLASIPLAGNGT